jgi:hypothetical protein
VKHYFARHPIWNSQGLSRSKHKLTTIYLIPLTKDKVHEEGFEEGKQSILALLWEHGSQELKNEAFKILCEHGIMDKDSGVMHKDIVPNTSRAKHLCLASNCKGFVRLGPFWPRSIPLTVS